MQVKRINPKAILYHYFEKSPTEFALFDDEMDMPVAWGSRGIVEGVVRSLQVHLDNVLIIHYKRDLDKVTFQNPRHLRYGTEKKKTLTKTERSRNLR